MESYQKLVDFVDSLKTDAEKFYVKEQAAAGTRFRKGLSDLKKMAQDLRNEVQELKNTRKGS
ncbi:MAG: histone H1 [Melioribacteraceae bacterium]|nr:histone H1 [Melioribacteraceae bacterium]MCF8264551.1 histone H1 [Melioribacteraceae bacterium]MCF8413745.1 histone H1 [Melioribacteraceae bacterium]MCF8432587.1 histone H1 [Melioribacteraceae bacterium]